MLIHHFLRNRYARTKFTTDRLGEFPISRCIKSQQLASGEATERGGVKYGERKATERGTIHHHAIKDCCLIWEAERLLTFATNPFTLPLYARAHRCPVVLSCVYRGFPGVLIVVEHLLDSFFYVK